MSKSRQSSLAIHRQRMKRKGFVRVEIQTRKEDAALVRGVAAALADPAREAETRAALRDFVGKPKSPSLKTLLAAAPLEGLDLERPRDVGRDVSI